MAHTIGGRRVRAIACSAIGQFYCCDVIRLREQESLAKGTLPTYVYSVSCLAILWDNCNCELKLFCVRIAQQVQRCNSTRG